MGQAWCKEKSNKAQDSKSPLDRVFLRCAHRIYPGLKEEGSVLGGATQRVTSSEIGYASSPPREVLTRGQSIDSVDRPFHPSDWVDVNLEVPVTPRTSTAMTSRALDTTVYPPPTFASTNFTGSRDFAPVPPPRRKKKNRGRPLPPKPDDVARSHVDRSAKNCTSLQKGHEPLCSSVKLSKNWSNDKEIFEHKINGTGRVIPSNVVAASRSSREESSRESEQNDSRRKNSSTTSLPNYLELQIVNEKSLGDDDQDMMRIRKITAAGSLPALITSGALEELKKSDNQKREGKKTTRKEDVDERGKKCAMDEVDFSFDLSGKIESQNSISKFEVPRLTSTPVKIGFENDSSSPTTVGGWFLHQVRAPGSDLLSTIETSDTRKNLFYDCHRDSRSEIFFEADENLLDESNDNRDMSAEKLENEVERRARTRLKRSLSNESEPFDTREEKDLERGEIDLTILRSNTEVKLLARTISEESLPREMLENEGTDFFEDKAPIATYERSERINDEKGETVGVGSTIEGDTKTPPPSPEPRITPEILDNDHSSRLKVVLHDEDSNLSSMTPSLTELEAALSDMLEREDDRILREDTSDKAQVDISTIKTMFSEIPVSLTNILGSKENSSSAESSPIKNLDDPLPMINVDLTKDGKNACPPGVPPEKPSRLSQTSHEEASVNSTNVPTPPRRRNRYSGYTSSIIDRTSLERTATPQNPYPNDRLI